MSPQTKIVLNYDLLEDVVVADVDTRDYPDFCDAYIESATYDGREMSPEELEILNEDSAYVYERAVDHAFRG